MLYCCSFPHSKEAYLLLYHFYYSWLEYAGRSITINHVHDLDLELSLRRTYWEWHIALLNPDMSWLILWWGSQVGLCHREWLHARSLTGGVGARIARLHLSGCQVMCSLWKFVHWEVQDFVQKHCRRDLGNVMMSLMDVDVSRLQSGNLKEVVLMNYSVGEWITRWRGKLSPFCMC